MIKSIFYLFCLLNLFQVSHNMLSQVSLFEMTCFSNTVLLTVLQGGQICCFLAFYQVFFWMINFEFAPLESEIENEHLKNITALCVSRPNAIKAASHLNLGTAAWGKKRRRRLLILMCSGSRQGLAWIMFDDM